MRRGGRMRGRVMMLIRRSDLCKVYHMYIRDIRVQNCRSLECHATLLASIYTIRCLFYSSMIWITEATSLCILVGLGSHLMHELKAKALRILDALNAC